MPLGTPTDNVTYSVNKVRSEAPCQQCMERKQKRSRHGKRFGELALVNDRSLSCVNVSKRYGHPLIAIFFFSLFWAFVKLPHQSWFFRFITERSCLLKKFICGHWTFINSGFGLFLLRRLFNQYAILWWIWRTHDNLVQQGILERRLVLRVKKLFKKII